MRRIAIVVAGLFVIVVTILWAHSRGDVGRRVRIEDHDLTGPSASEEESVHKENSMPMLDTRAGPTSSRSIPTDTILVLDSGRRPIEGALVTWTILDHNREYGVWPDLNWPEVELCTSRGMADADGVCSINPPQCAIDGGASAIWVSHPDYHAVSISLEYPSELGLLPSEVVLERSPPFSAEVSYRDGTVARKATIYQYLYCEPKTSETGLALKLQGSRVLRHSYEVDLHGKARLDPLPGLNWIWATDGEFVSSAWRGESPANVMLELGPTFVASGHVSVELGEGIPTGTAVKWSIRRGSRDEFVGSSSVSVMGTWGPDSIPIRACDSYVFWIEGPNLIRKEHSLHPPGNGEVIEVNLATARGLEVPVLVVGPEEERVADASVVGRWNQDDAWLSAGARTDTDGAASVCGLPPQVIYFRAFRDGYSEAAADPIELSEVPRDPIVIRLGKAGTISGRCVRNSEPVTSFELMWWKEPDLSISRQSVEGNSKGEFVIHRAPLGEVTLLAVSNEHLQSNPEVVHVQDNVSSQVILTFPDTLNGQGRVIDAITSEAISGARVHLLTNVRGKRIEPQGSSISTDAHGVFSIAGLVSDRSPIEVSAPGYATRTAFGRGSREGLADFGVVPLSTRQSLALRLESADAQVDFSQYVCELLGTAHIPDRTFTLGGVLNYESLDPGAYTARIVYPGQRTYQDVAFIMNPRKETLIRVKINSGVLQVHVIAEEGEKIPADAMLSVHWELDSENSTCQYYGIPPNGEVLVADVSGPMVVTVETWAGDLLGVTQVGSQHSPDSPIEVRLGAAPLSIRTVDGARRPLSGVTVYLTHPSPEVEWCQVKQSDADGLCTFTGVSADPILALLHRYPQGYMAGQLVMKSPVESNPIDVVFDPDWDLRVVLLERGVLVEGVDVVADDPEGIRHLPRTTSDSDGIASIARVSGAGWNVSVAHPGYWSTGITIGPSDPSPMPMQVRRLGSVRLDLRTPYGMPVGGVAIDLESMELLQQVSSWVNAGLVRCSSADLKTSTDGSLRFDAIPNGPYRWRAVLDSGEVVEGEVTVPPQSTAVVEATVP